MPVSLQDLLHGVQPAVSREVTRDPNSPVHVFSSKGLDFAYDAASGSLHVLDALGRDLLLWAADNPGEWKHPTGVLPSPPAGLIESLRGKYGEAEIADAWSEFRSSVGYTLFCADEALETPERPEDVLQAVGAGLKSMCMDVAHDCNLGCCYCFASTGDFGGVRCVMTPEVGREAVDFLIRNSRNRRYLDVDFFGGEPLLAFDTVEAVLQYAREEGARRGKEFRFTLTTNCTLLDSAKARFLNENDVSLILSLDGRPEVHDRMRPFSTGRPSHEVAMERAVAAAKSRTAKGYCIVRGTYTKYNLDFDQDIKYLYENGFRHISLEPAVGETAAPWAIGVEDLPEVREAYSRTVDFWVDCARKGDPFEFYHFELGLDRGLCRERRVTGCGAGYEYVAVTPEGHIYPCHQLVGKSEYLMGDIRTGIRREDLMHKFCRSRVPHKPECISCWARYLCGGGCHARAVESTSDLLKPDPLSCAVMKVRLECALSGQFLLRKVREK